MLSLDRIVDGKAVLLNEQDESIVIDAKLLPREAKEGDIVFRQNHSYAIDKELTKQKQDELRLRLNKLTKK